MKYKKWLDKNIPDLKGNTIIVTGANSGIGFWCAKSLVYKNAKVIMACRNIRKAQQAKEEILKDFPKANIEIKIIDISDFSSIEKFIDNIKNIKIDALINNAGIYFPSKNTLTKNNIDITMGTNYFGTYYLSELIEKTHSEINKIINVTSLTYRHTTLDLEDLKCNQIKNRNSLYAKSKLAIAAYTLAKQEGNNKINYYLVHPGVSATNIISSKNGGFSKTFSKLGNIFLKIFCHSPQKACLSLLYPFATKEKAGTYGPKFLQINGYPKKINNTKEQIKLKDQIIDKTDQVLDSMNFKIK